MVGAEKQACMFRTDWEVHIHIFINMCKQIDLRESMYIIVHAKISAKVNTMQSRLVSFAISLYSLNNTFHKI